MTAPVSDATATVSSTRMPEAQLAPQLAPSPAMPLPQLAPQDLVMVPVQGNIVANRIVNCECKYGGSGESCMLLKPDVTHVMSARLKHCISGMTLLFKTGQNSLGRAT